MDQDAGAVRLLDQRERERAAIATALHDEAAQTLANVALHLQICERAIAVDPERGRQELAGARTALTEAINRLRQQIFALRPVTLEEAGLGPALRRYLGTLPTRVELTDRLDGHRLDGRAELGLFRIAQAALGRAPHDASVDLARQSGEVLLTVRGAAGELDEARDWAAALGADLAVEKDQLTVSLSA